MELKQITIRYPSIKKDNHPIIHNFSYTFPKKGLVVIIGDSGIGKSSLLKLLAGSIAPTSGSLHIPKNWQHQKPVFLEDQLTLISHWKIKDYFHPFALNQILLKLALDPNMVSEPFQNLSVGQRIRVMLGLFFSIQSNCYLLDEPTHALDKKSRDAVIRYIGEHALSHLIVIATHDPFLIAKANEVIHVHSPYQITLSHQFDEPTQNSIIQPTIEPPIQTWKKLFKRLHQGKGMGIFLMLASLILQTSIQILLIMHHGLNQQQSIFQTMMKQERLYVVQEIQRTSIDQSPFQLVKTIAPNVDQLMMAFSTLDGVQFYPWIESWFPSTYIVEGVHYRVRMVDMPFIPGKISLGLVHLPQHDIYHFQLDSLTVDAMVLPISLQGQINMLGKRVVQSFFEPPQILISYWQCLYLLQTTNISPALDAMNYLNWYTSQLPPEGVLAYDSNHRLQSLLMINPDHHPWTISSSLKQTYESMSLLLPSLLRLMIGTTVTILLLTLFVWWTRLHWVYQKHHPQWHWFKRLGFLVKPIWIWISSRMHLYWEIFHLILAMVVSTLIYFHPGFITIQTFYLAIITLSSMVGFFIIRSLLLNRYVHA
jgi:ABC-type lipoprotein export system ATPase subunit